MLERLQLPGHWRLPAIVLLVLWLAILGIYHQTAVGMVSIWARSDTYAHGFVVPLISAWLVWRMRHALLAMRPEPSRLAWVLMLGVCLVWFAGHLVAVNAVTQLALVTMLVLAVPAVCGWSLTWAMAFPLGFLYFAVPVGDFLLPTLMSHTADFTVFALRLTGIPVYREGLQFVIPSGSWSVVEACSGIRYLIASLTVGSLFAYLSFQSTRKRLVFVGVSLLVPLVANWLRAYLIVLLGHFSGNELATGVDHLIYGWVFFGLVILVMLFVGARYADAPKAIQASTGGRPTGEGAADRTGALVGGLAVVLLVLLLPMGLERWMAGSIVKEPVRWAPLALQPPWSPVDDQPSGWAPSFANASAVRHLLFASNKGTPVGLHLSYYRQQDYTRKLVSSTNTLVHSEDDQWVRVGADGVPTKLAEQPLRVWAESLREKRVGLGSSGKRLRAWRFYWVDDSFTASDLQAKLLGARSLLRARGDDGAIVVLYTPVDPSLPEDQGRERSDQTLRDFLHLHGEALSTMLRQTRGDI